MVAAVLIAGEDAEEPVAERRPAMARGEELAVGLARIGTSGGPFQALGYAAGVVPASVGLGDE